MDRAPHVQYKPGIEIGSLVGIELTAAEWLQVYEYLYWSEVSGHEGNANPGTAHLQNAIMRALVTESFLKEADAHREEHEARRAEAQGPAGFLRSLGLMIPGTQLPSPEDFDKTAVCPNCGTESPLVQWEPVSSNGMACPHCDYAVDTR